MAIDDVHMKETTGAVSDNFHNLNHMMEQHPKIRQLSRGFTSF